jgi:hypothetical protein
VTLPELIAVLNEADRPALVYESGDGTRVLLLPHGGRVLGLFASESDENFYWTNTALRSVETARRLFEGGDWQNSGGDRTWLAPEIDIFFPQYPNLDMSTYLQPRALDPGSYVIEERAGFRALVNRLSLTLSRSKRRIDLEIAKWVGPAPNPLRHESLWHTSAGVRYAGYTQHTRLERLGGDPLNGEDPVGLWNLIQMPHGGELVVPTYSRSEPKIYMGAIGPDDLRVSPRAVRYRMWAQGEHKIGVRAVALTGRAGYLWGGGDEASLIIRNFLVNPSGEYVDVPWTEERNFGFALQACNVNSKWGEFSELEYHVPAMGAGISSMEDTSQVWAYRGPEAEIRRIAETLLGTE